ncbi:uncharacterized protein UV8b_04703 [Ustilaginoidea virens]|uniref:Uncharacterized protein n=1 Tax=Ustilaginoidea virens TaxID=1159556 RepID=A0A8E5MHZ5_USTVR|nr:uncharacterized protein UV8b_04703 [Ustilaginoidea virens]QUC20462.1 hypothetical protein UV8b_04703 [Ustilaginoidea virens]
MTPPCHSFPAAELPSRIQLDVHGRRRKHDPPRRGIDLSACQLLSLLQYKCPPEKAASADGPVRCFPVERLFRRCADRKGTFTVETTAWEGGDAASGGHGRGGLGGSSAGPQQWSTGWADGGGRGQVMET